MNPRRKLFLMMGISLTILVFWGWVLARLLQQVKNTNITLRELEEKVGELETRRKMAGDMQILFQDRAEDFSKIKSFSVNKERPVVFIEDLEDIARKTLNRIGINFDEGKSKDKNIYFRLMVDGSEDSLLKYLKLLELLPYKIKVEEVSFQKLTSSEFSAALSIPKESEVPLSHRLEVLIGVDIL